MTGRLTRGIGAVAVVAATLTVPSACFWDKGDDEPSRGNVERTDTITASDLVLVSNGEGRATMVGRILNEADRADRLVGVDVATDSGPVEVTMPRGEVELLPGEPVRLAPDPTVVVTSNELRQGFRVDVTLDFALSESIDTTVTVESRSGPYADVTVPPAA